MQKIGYTETQTLDLSVNSRLLFSAELCNRQLFPALQGPLYESSWQKKNEERKKAERQKNLSGWLRAHVVTKQLPIPSNVIGTV